MKVAGGFDRFQDALADLASLYLKPAWNAKKQGKPLERPSDQQFSTVFYGFTEISNTLDALTLVERLMGLAPPRSKKIKKDEYIRFLVGGYLHEVYILRERLTTYAKRIARSYGVGKELQKLVKHVDEFLEGICRVRGGHVHSSRYSDEKLDALSTMVLVASVKKEFADDVHLDYWLVRSDWKKRIRNNNAVMRKLMDVYCDTLLRHMLRDGKLFLPQGQPRLRRTSPSGA